MTKIEHSEEHESTESAWTAEWVREIGRYRLELAKALAETEGSALEAQRAIDALRGASVYDTDLADTTEGEDLAAHIATAGRALRAAMAILNGVGE
jgi:hypothetical protein